MTFKSVLGKLKDHASIIVWLISLAVVAGLLLSYEKHVLWLVQEQSLFLDTSQFFSQQPQGTQHSHAQHRMIQQLRKETTYVHK